MESAQMSRASQTLPAHWNYCASWEETLRQPFMLGAIMNGDTLETASAYAGEFVKNCIEYTFAQNTDPMHGVMFEKLLGRLMR